MTTLQDARTAYEIAYKESFDADDAFTAALRRAYGPKATRWDHKLSEYPENVRAAYLRKVDADEARHDALKAWRNFNALVIS